MTSFLQSSEWADFQKRLGRSVWQIDGINVIKHKLPMNKSYLYSPYLDLPRDIDKFVKQIGKIAKKENAIFFKIEPLNYARGKFALEDFGFIKSNNIQPLRTIVLDIIKSEQEILNQMHSKMRYNINLAQKKGIVVRVGNNQHDFEEFWRLTLKTGKKDGFRHYTKEYYKKMLEIPGIKLFLAEYSSTSLGASQNKIIVANIVVFYGQMAIYLHGASDYEYRNLMAAPLLQWHQILEAKKAGCAEYDFWGIDEIKWPGVTRFKKSFGGKEIIYPGAYDLVFQPMWYRIYKIARKFL
ncbi:MAG TPA: peptidoglycan bridge formation glycyltransferase FemA/FemB family protein [Candidatus Paceibacterota bacterium]|nr:peptidoglycan bridge formation glycyltransferase FemA/FemB family protein [Candidatus Paceibacterota bacterium]